MFSQILKELREYKQISQATLAQNMNVAQQTVGKWERDITYPNIDTLKNLAAFFDVTTDYLLEMPVAAHSLRLTAYEHGHMKKYCELSAENRVVVDATLDALWQQEHAANVTKPAYEKRAMS